MEKEIKEMHASAVLEMIPSFSQSSFHGIDDVTGNITNETNEEVAAIPQHGQSQSLAEEDDDHHTVIGIPAGEWSKNLNKLPAFTEAMIDNHLIYKSSTMPDKKDAQAYRHKQKGYKLFKEGYVQKLFVKSNVKIRDIARFLVKTKVAASMKQQLYNVYVHLLQKNGEVFFANCNCKSGKGGCCKHVAATLYTLWDYSKLGLKVVPDDLTCTQVAQKWHVPTQAARQSIKAVYFEELSFEKADFKRDQNGSRKRAIVNGLREDYCATPEFAKQANRNEIEQLATALRKSGKCQLLMVALEGNEYEPCTMFQTSCQRAMNSNDHHAKVAGSEEKTLSLNFEETGFFERFATYVPSVENKTMNEHCHKYLFQKIALDSKQAEEIELETRLQSVSKSWFAHRSIRLTSSNFGKVITRKETTDPTKLVEEVTKEKVMKNCERLPPSLKWGRENEALAIERYSCERAASTVLNTGLIVNPKYPWLGCSPDGIVLSKEGTIEGCIEVKCPYTHRDKKVKEATQDKKFFMVETQHGPNLKRRHQYYFQCQGVMALTELPWIDFIAFTTKDLQVERIVYDEALWQNVMLPKLNSFYFDHILPHLVDKAELD